MMMIKPKQKLNKSIYRSFQFAIDVHCSIGVFFWQKKVTVNKDLHIIIAYSDSNIRVKNV